MQNGKALGRRRSRQLGRGSCMQYPRWVRGTIGGAVGLLAGALGAWLEDELFIAAMKNNAPRVLRFVTVVGTTAAGVYIGARKPEC